MEYIALKPKMLDITGKRFNMVVALGAVGKNSSGALVWRFECDCGKIFDSTPSHFKSGRNKSCGCIHKDTITKHGYSKNPLYSIYTSMIARCKNPNSTSYHRYGARGISVCDRWLNSFEDFCSDIGDRPSHQHSIDRIDNNKDYYPDNCKWATKKEQARNRRNTKLITHNGRTASIPEWSEITGIPQQLIQTRIRRGWSDEDAISISNCRATL